MSGTTAVLDQDLRARFLELIRGDLLGPAAGPQERLGADGDLKNLRPRDRYLIGMLPPSGTEVEPDTDEEIDVEDDAAEDGGAREEAAGTRGLMPSSIGMTFHVDDACDTIRIRARWGRYRKVEGESEGEPRAWTREQIDEWVDVDIASARAIEERPCDEQPEVTIEGVVRSHNGARAVTLFLRNGQDRPDRLEDEAWLFQVELEVSAPDGTACFVERPLPVHSDPERAWLQMAYRERVEFAAGHGVAVRVETASGEPRRAVRVATSTLPTFEVAQMRAPLDEPLLAGLVTDMEQLGAAADDDIEAMLRPLADGYRAWLKQQLDTVPSLGDHEETAKITVARALDVCERLDESIDLLASDSDAGRVARDAFRFANRAMHQQRIHSTWAHKRREGAAKLKVDEVAASQPWTWFPFQLAFVLLNIPALVDPSHSTRSGDDAICDLLWFPTGGGKTEAYLGVAAFTLAVRRLQGDIGGYRADAGLAVLMRYTLRVLTLQQFQRASALICACELERRRDPATWGDEPFTIGLWVGSSSTPNKLSAAAEAMRTAHAKELSSGHGRPDQLQSCPWCGSDIRPADVLVETVESGRARVVQYCGHKYNTCEFVRANSPGEGLPIITVDEEIYRRAPSMLIATVDKFARLPWEGATQTLFGEVDGRCTRHGWRNPSLDQDHPKSHKATAKLSAAATVDEGVRLRPPDLVIQDELHLIAGPLGSMVGLYETAIDHLMEWALDDGTVVRPKVIASTATIRQADRQVRHLFDRQVQVFPPPALDAGDSFFAKEQPTSEEFGRLYLGICTPGRRLKQALIRTYLACLASGEYMYSKDGGTGHGSRVDSWMTLVGYFNSIRELAGMRRMCEDDVRTRLRKMEHRGLANRRMSEHTIDELTSRLGALQIPRLLDRMEQRFDPANNITAGTRDKSQPTYPLDVLLATSMIGVGVDIGRLGLMVVGGQPKTTSDYIQATSRVGRASPGIVITVYNWARPRDLSHFERFEHYHSSFYAHVEPLSVTPFAERAVDRGLTGVLASLVRHHDLAHNVNDAAGKVNGADAAIADAKQVILARARRTTDDERVEEAVGHVLDSRIDEWLERVRRAEDIDLGYTDAPGVIGLLEDAELAATNGGWGSFTVLNSLRDVEREANLVISYGPLYPSEED